MKPLTCIAVVVLGRHSNVLEPSLIMATADANLWRRQPQEPNGIVSPVIFTDEPVKTLQYQLNQFLLQWSFVDYRHSPLTLPFPGVSYFSNHKMIEVWLGLQSFRPESGNWYLDMRLYNTQDRGVIGPFATRAGVMAWALNAAAQLTIKKAKVPHDGWYRVFEG
jgi:hypothetical protein